MKNNLNAVCVTRFWYLILVMYYTILACQYKLYVIYYYNVFYRNYIIGYIKLLFVNQMNRNIDYRLEINDSSVFQTVVRYNGFNRATPDWRNIRIYRHFYILSASNKTSGQYK